MRKRYELRDKQWAMTTNWVKNVNTEYKKDGKN